MDHRFLVAHGCAARKSSTLLFLLLDLRSLNRACTGSGVFWQILDGFVQSFHNPRR